jgi:hypothetical protein
VASLPFPPIVAFVDCENALKDTNKDSSTTAAETYLLMSAPF